MTSAWTRVPKALRVDEVERLLNAPDTSTPLGLRDRAMLEFAYATGARAAEVVTFPVHALSVTEQVARIRGKGGHERIVPVGRPAMEWIRRYRTDMRPIVVTEPDHGILFVSRYGRPLSTWGFWYMVKGYSAATGLEVTPHVLRHSFATHLLQGGANLRHVQELLGHKSIITTQIYTKVTLGYVTEQHRRYHPLEKGVSDE